MTYHYIYKSVHSHPQVELLKSCLTRTRVKMSVALDSMVQHAETFAEYDPMITPPQPSNPWVTDDLTYWQLNNSMSAPIFTQSPILPVVNVVTPFSNYSEWRHPRRSASAAGPCPSRSWFPTPLAFRSWRPTFARSTPTKIYASGRRRMTCDGARNHKYNAKSTKFTSNWWIDVV